MAGVGEALQSMHQNRTAAVGRRQLRRRELKLVHAGLPWLVVLVVLIVIVVWALMAGHRDFLLSGVSPACPNKCPPYQWGPNNESPNSWALDVRNAITGQRNPHQQCP